MPPQVCKFWMNGNCRFGDQCRFVHPADANANANQIPVNNNRFAPLQNNSNNSRNQQGGFQQNGTARHNGFGQQNGNNRQIENSQDQLKPFQLDRNAIITDLGPERPEWILSAYGPGRNAPDQLFGGPLREQSFEEIHLLYYLENQATGSFVQADEHWKELNRAAKQQIENALNNVDDGIKYIIAKEHAHPNRIDICQQNTSNTSNASQNPFSNRLSNPPPLLEAPSQPAFGAPSQSSAFGAPSQLGSGGAFGQPSALGSQPNPFGAPSGGSGFANNRTAPFSGFANTPSPFSQLPLANANPFGASSQAPAAPNPFAPANPLNQPSNPFSAPSNGFVTNGASPSGSSFGKPSMGSQFGTSVLGQTQAGTFGQPATFGQKPSAFGAPLQPAAFGASPQPLALEASSQNNAFGVSTSQPSMSHNSFAITAQPNVFGNPLASANPVQQNTFNSFQQQQPTTNGLSSAQDSANHIVKDGSGRLVSFKGQRVQYKGDEPGILINNGSWKKIWFPNGPPGPNATTEMEGEVYDEQIKASYMHMQQTGAFKDGVIPLVPPKREWCSWDF